MTSSPSHQEMANAIRFLSADAVQKANSGHPGMPMGMADVATVLLSRFMNFSASNPDWPDRDRLILSAGHGSMLLYSLLHLTGYKDFQLMKLKIFDNSDLVLQVIQSSAMVQVLKLQQGLLGKDWRMLQEWHWLSACSQKDSAVRS